MTEALKPMDVYGRMDVPFDVAAYCRGHKFSGEAVALTRAIKAKDAAKAMLEAAEREVDEAQIRLDHAIAAARTRMDGDRHA